MYMFQNKGMVDWDGIVEQVFSNEYECKHEAHDTVKAESS